eukprot:CAMPEP_0183401650 /NCGR_PEP_ID=MMETSP0370-20130417/13395_1 /TAXON_ID=268820 /ORGANISM="Peridinium aciculiferum, Strain PAER-2" /LENGTH=51 /DNA_ID=CAMNT_0025583127 /DNA_START=35 /DNA_END=190 /DNA_ORIENTATION=+
MAAPMVTIADHPMPPVTQRHAKAQALCDLWRGQIEFVVELKACTPLRLAVE